MSGKGIKFDGKKINKSELHKNKKIFDSTDENDDDKILASKKQSYGTNK